MSYNVHLTDNPNEGERGFTAEETVSVPLLSVGHAAKYLGAGREAVYRLIEWGELRAVKASGSVYIEKTSLDSYRDRGKLT